MSNYMQFPPQQLPFKRKGKQWRKQCVDWGAQKTFFNHELVRNTVIHKKINYDLVNGILHMDDVRDVINPTRTKIKGLTDNIQHYPIMNSKLDVLIGEESKRIFDFKVIVTNPNAISEIEESKKQEVLKRLQELLANQALSEEEFNQELSKLDKDFKYNWQDLREIRANALLNHYSKELNFNLIFNTGFKDAVTVGEEIYQCDIVGGEPTLEKINPLKIRVFRSGYSNKIEDADVIILEDYWSPGKIIDTFYDSLTEKDMKYIENLPNMQHGATDSMDNIDDRAGMVHINMVSDSMENSGLYFSHLNIFDNTVDELLPYDLSGNIRVVRMYWKSRRKIKKVKSYDPQTGEEMFNFYPEDYVLNTVMGEEEEIYYINEAWEGTKIGEDIYVNMRPRVVQYNRLSNPSRCHFGIIGSVYNLNDNKPFSLVDKMKPFNYMYDAIHDRINKLIAKNWGKIINVDLAKMPKGWTMDKWLYFAKNNSIAVVDSFNEGNYGAATGKLAGGLNNAHSGVIDAELGQSISSQIQLLEYIKSEMAEVVGISKQREGQVSNRETVGGVERANLQSSYITEWLFVTHDDVKRRVLECFIETAKIALQGRSKKFEYILPDHSMQVIEIDGDEFAECDYGLIVDNSSGTQELNQKLDMLAQAGLQNQTISLSAIMKLYTSISMAEKIRIIENAEQEVIQRQQSAMQQEQQTQQQQIEARQQEAAARIEHEDALNQRDNETRIIVAEINSKAEAERFALMSGDDSNASKELAERMRQFDKRLEFDREKLEFDKQKAETDAELREKQINKQSVKNK